MSDERSLSRQAVRAAVRIHEHLRGAGSRGGVGALPTGRWNEVRRIFSQYELTQRRGWQAASGVLARDLDYQFRRLAAEVDAARGDLPQPRHAVHISPASTIAADLLAIPNEFEAIAIDLKEKLLRVDTDRIVLEDLDLGPFQIVLRWERIGHGQAYQVKALAPHCAGGRPDVTHPHVEDHLLCEGAGAAAIGSALASGRLLDFFVLVRQILETYNGSSPYVALSDWSEGSSVSCDDCGYDMSVEDRSYCDRCDCSVCSDCSNRCEGCDHYLCSECSPACSGCSHKFCLSCLTEDADTEQQLCETCLSKKEEPTDEDDQCEPAEADAVCLGEAAVPA